MASPTVQDLAILLRATRFEDRHRIVTALTERHGLITALAKNAIQSRRFGGSLDIFAASEWTFQERPGADLVFLQEARIRRGFENLARDLDRLAVASALNELALRALPPREPCPEIFKLHAQALAALDEAPAGTDARGLLPLLNAYLARFLHWSGHAPDLAQCRGCARPAEALPPESVLHCVIADAAWICAECRAAGFTLAASAAASGLRFAQLQLTPAAARDLGRALSLPLRTAIAETAASGREHEDLLAFLEALIAYHLPGFDSATPAEAASGRPVPLRSLAMLRGGESGELLGG